MTGWARAPMVITAAQKIGMCASPMLVFFGMSVMGESMEPLRSYEPFVDLMATVPKQITPDRPHTIEITLARRVDQIVPLARHHHADRIPSRRRAAVGCPCDRRMA